VREGDQCCSPPIKGNKELKGCFIGEGTRWRGYATTKGGRGSKTPSWAGERTVVFSRVNMAGGYNDGGDEVRGGGEGCLVRKEMDAGTRKKRSSTERPSCFCWKENYLEGGEKKRNARGSGNCGKNGNPLR